MSVTVVCDPWRPHPLAWIHRAEARSIADELRRAGHSVAAVRFHESTASALPAGSLLRLSDPVMLAAAQALGRSGIPYFGPSAAAMERCYDKYAAHQMAVAGGMDTPRTMLGADPGPVPLPAVLKPRRGSDSIGVRLLERDAIPAAQRNEHWLVQEHVQGMELTVGVLHGQAGIPLTIGLPEGELYTFTRKYLRRAPIAPLTELALVERVRRLAVGIAGILEVDWAARVDLVYQARTDRLCLLECDVAPLVGARSAFAASLAACGIPRAQQLSLLLTRP